jgi:hypothetical protein
VLGRARRARASRWLRDVRCNFVDCTLFLVHYSTARLEPHKRPAYASTESFFNSKTSRPRIE